MWGQMFPQISSVFFFFLKLDILKIVEKIWFFVTYNMPPFQKMQIDDIWNLLLWTFFQKKKEALLFENFAHWDPAKLLEDVQQKLLPVSGVGSWCLGPGTEVPPRLQRVVRGISQQRSFLVETSAWKCQAPRWGVYMQHVSEVTILHDEFPPRIKDKQQTKPYFWLNLRISDPKVYVLWVIGAYVFPMKILWQIMVLAAWFILYLAIVIPAFWPIAARLRLFDPTGLEGYWPWRMA